MPVPSVTNFFTYFVVFLSLLHNLRNSINIAVIKLLFSNSHLDSHPLLGVCIYNMYCTYICIIPGVALSLRSVTALQFFLDRNSSKYMQVWGLMNSPGQMDYF